MAKKKSLIERAKIDAFDFPFGRLDPKNKKASGKGKKRSGKRGGRSFGS
jgi:hypothetical protein